MTFPLFKSQQRVGLKKANKQNSPSHRLASDEPIQRTFKDVINKANLKDAAQRIKEEKVGKGRENDQKLNKIEKTIHANLQLNPPGVAAPKTGYTARILYDMKNCQKVVDKKA